MAKKPTYEELEQRVKELQLEANKLKHTEDALQETSDYLENLINYANAPIIVWDPEERINRFNHAFERLTGYKGEGVIGKKLDMLFPETSRSESLSKIENTLKGEFWKSVEIPILCKDRDIRIVLWNSANIYAEDGKTLLATIAQGQDITERKQVEETLKKERERFRVLVEEFPVGVSIIGEDGRYQYLNPKFVQIFGYTLEDIPTGREWFKKAYPDKEYRNQVVSSWINDLKYKKFGESRLQTFAVTCKDGSEKIIIFRPVTMDTGDQFVVYSDITERKFLEAQLQHTQKMEAIATLAGGIAHEFNNALTGITGNIELLNMDLPKEGGFNRYIDPMKASAHRMANLTNQLLAYARGGKYQPTTISLSDFIEDTLPILKSTIKPSIRVETDLPRVISKVKVDPTQMQMVLSAVLSNASEAIEGEGRIRINTGDEEIDEDFAKDHPDIEPGSYVCLTIEDDGKGMDEETRSKIFDPFFTTKFQGRGLGMAAVYGIIRNHDGWVLVDSKLDKWTVVRIYFPALKVEEEQVPEERVEGPKTEVAMGTGTILVIEDEEIVMDLTHALLEGLGYRVLEAKTGKEAVDIAKGFDGDIDLALLDIKLPDIMGDKVYPLIMEARPNLKVIVCSGYSIDGPAQKIIDAGAQGFIQKPFTLKILAEKLKEVLEG